MTWSVRSLWLVVCLPVFAACYTYTTVPIESVPVGSAVRAHISGAESDSLSQELRQDEGRAVEGHLLERQSDGNLLLSIPSSLTQEDGLVSQMYQRVELP